MAGRTSVAWGADLLQGATRFAEWRRRREVGARIPAALWDLAVELAARHGVSRTSQALRVDYYTTLSCCDGGTFFAFIFLVVWIYV